MSRSKNNILMRSPDGAKRNPGINRLSPDCGAAHLHPGYIFLMNPRHVARMERSVMRGNNIFPDSGLSVLHPGYRI
jgi:hypothetical protein